MFTITRQRRVYNVIIFVANLTFSNKFIKIHSMTTVFVYITRMILLLLLLLSMANLEGNDGTVEGIVCGREHALGLITTWESNCKGSSANFSLSPKVCSFPLIFWWVCLLSNCTYAYAHTEREKGFSWW